MVVHKGLCAAARLRGLPNMPHILSCIRPTAQEKCPRCDAMHLCFAQFHTRSSGVQNALSTVVSIVIRCAWLLQRSIESTCVRLQSVVSCRPCSIHALLSNTVQQSSQIQRSDNPQVKTALDSHTAIHCHTLPYTECYRCIRPGSI